MALEFGNPGQPLYLAENGVRLVTHVGKTWPGAPLHKLTALVDTGAPAPYYIDATLARRLALRAIDGSSVVTRSVAGEDRQPAYMARVSIERLGVSVPIARLIGFDIGRIGGDFEVILGRHFLRNYRMVYDGRSGSVTVETAASGG